MTEKWKTVQNFPNYEVSNEGRVRNKKTCKVLSPNCVKGYLRARLYKNGVPTPIFIHRLVASAFIENPKGKPYVNHIDGNKKNNEAKNLEWATGSENELHAYKTGLKKGYAPKGSYSVLSKKVAMMDLNGNVLRIFPCVKEVERSLGYFVSNIVNVCNGKRKTCHGYKWKYVGGGVL